MQVKQYEPSRFFEPTDPPTDPPSPMRIELTRLVEEGHECWALDIPIGYKDAHFTQPIIVPSQATRDTFRTDLTSVPQFFTWLVPKTGAHLPAALIHDGLIGPEDQPTYDGPPQVSRRDADRVFRDAMADLQTPLVRRWLIWTAVSLATARSLGAWAVAAYGSLAVVGVLGILATLDLVDVWNVLPWMGNHPWWWELLAGAAAALLLPALLALTWAPLRLYRAGLIACWALAFLLHVTAVVLVITGMYKVIEAVAGVIVRDNPD